jgi:hypothetical protein
VEAYGSLYRPDKDFLLYGPPRLLTYLQDLLHRR